jgi:ribose transport system permease protein
MTDNVVKLQLIINKIYQKNKNIHNTLLMILTVFVGGELILSGLLGKTPGSFLSVSQLLLTIRLSSFIAFFGLCQMIVICVGGGGLDLSVGYTATLSGVVTCLIMDGSDANLPLAILVAIIIGFLIGLANGFLAAYAKLPSLVVTMAMANIVQGIVNAYVNKNYISGISAPVVRWLVARFTGVFPNRLIIIIILIFAVKVVMEKTQIGVRAFGVGSNESVAFLSGINVRRVRLISFVISGILAALIGILLAGDIGNASKDMGSIYVMPSIVAVVIGGISINGGQGDYLAVVLGAIVLQSLTNLFVAMGWGDAGKWLGYGIILLLMLVLYVRTKKNK